jgi:hypothetical protein
LGGCKSFGFKKEDCNLDDDCFWNASITDTVLKCSDVLIVDTCADANIEKECEKAVQGDCRFTAESTNSIYGYCEYFDPESCSTFSGDRTKCESNNFCYDDDNVCKELTEHLYCYSS